MSKHEFFLEKRPAAIVAFQRAAKGETIQALEDEDPLMRELRVVFDWMARERGATRISSRLFKQRLPEIHRKFPQLATNFARMDANRDCWLDWEEFAAFCMKDERLAKSFQRAAAIGVFGLGRGGERTFKDPFDPSYMCELSRCPPILPWEVAHIVEWRLTGIKPGTRGKPVTMGGMPARPGQCFASPPFRAAGVCGFLRFWPAGYWTETQRARKLAEIQGTQALASEGRCEPPPASSWCCIGACLPSGTHLELRFFIGDAVSPRRECYWDEGVHVLQLWSPDAAEPPAALEQSATLVVGIEIFRNLDTQKNIVESPHKTTAHEQRVTRRPLLKDPFGCDAPKGSVLLDGRAPSLPRLQRPATTSVSGHLQATQSSVRSAIGGSSSARDSAPTSGPLESLRQTAMPATRFAFSTGSLVHV